MANDPAFDYYGNAPGIWGRLRARWSNMPSAYRYNAVLYGLAVVALTALVLEVALGESSPKFEVATQVAPLTTTTRPRPTTTFGPTTTIDPLAVTTTVPGVAGAEGGASPIGPLTPTSRRAGAAERRPDVRRRFQHDETHEPAAVGGADPQLDVPAPPPAEQPGHDEPSEDRPTPDDPHPPCRPPSRRSPFRPSGATGSPGSSAVPERWHPGRAAVARLT